MFRRKGRSSRLVFDHRSVAAKATAQRVIAIMASSFLLFGSILVGTASSIPPECRDAVDNEGDGAIDSEDPSCESPDDNSEFPFDEVYQAKVTLRYARWDWRFYGRVESAYARCERRSMVSVWGGRFVGRDLTNMFGRWRVWHRGRKGRYVAVLRRKTFFEDNGHRIICSSDESRYVRVRRGG